MQQNCYCLSYNTEWHLSFSLQNKNPLLSTIISSYASFPVRFMTPFVIAFSQSFSLAVALEPVVSLWEIEVGIRNEVCSFVCESQRKCIVPKAVIITYADLDIRVLPLQHRGIIAKLHTVWSECIATQKKMGFIAPNIFWSTYFLLLLHSIDILVKNTRFWYCVLMK